MGSRQTLAVLGAPWTLMLIQLPLCATLLRCCAAEEAIAAVKRDGVTKLVVLPLYPQFSVSTSGSSLRLLETLLKEDPVLRQVHMRVWMRAGGVGRTSLLARGLRTLPPPPPPQQPLFAPSVQVKHVVIPSWYQRPGYVRAMGDLILAELQRFPAAQRDEAHIFFSAHGVPLSYVEEGE